MSAENYDQVFDKEPETQNTQNCFLCPNCGEPRPGGRKASQKRIAAIEEKMYKE